MAIIKKDGNFMGLPMNIARGNPIPLDTTAVWYSYDELVEYAVSGATAYVGQILAHVDETNNTAQAYIIVDQAGTLEPVGSGVMADEKSIVVNADNALSLHDFGQKFYKYIPAVVDQAGNITTPASYELVEVSEENPWSEGLEPRVVLQGTEYVLGWYEPNQTTIEGVNAQVATLQTTVNNHTSQIEDLISDLGALDTVVGYPAEGDTAASGIFAELENKANASDVYTIEQTDNAISAAIAKADHLSRKIVGSLSEINVNAEDADKYVYMVPVTSGAEATDGYDEYMVINGKLEKVGSWEVDLSQYATTEDVNTALAKKVDAKEGFDLVSTSEITKLAGIEAGAEPNFIKTVASELVVNEAGQLSVGNIEMSKVVDLESTLASKVDAEEGYRLMAVTEGTKLEGIEAGAQVNVIDGVSDEFTIDDNKILHLVPIKIADIQDLQGALDSKIESVTLNDLDASLLQSINQIETNTSAIEDINEILNGYTAEDGAEVVGLRSVVNTMQRNMTELITTVGNHSTDIQGLQDTIDGLGNIYVAQSTFNSVLGNYAELEAANTTVVQELKELADRLAWHELSE